MGGLSIERLWSIAFRDLKRNRRRSLLTILAVTLGLALLIFASGLLEGGLQGALENSIRLQTGHLQVRAATYEEEKLSLEWEHLLANPYGMAAEIQALDGVIVATPVLWASGILSTRDESVGLRVFGIDPLSEASTPFREGLVAGEFLDPEDRSGIFMGERLAKGLGLSVGDRVRLMVPTADDLPDEAIFELRGLYSTGIPSYDDTTVFLPLEKAQAFTRAGDRSSAIFILLERQDDTDAVATHLLAPDRTVLTWSELNRLLLDSVDMSAGMMNLVYFIVLAVVAVVIANTLLMAVFERTREMGILAALGMKGRQILAMFVLEAATLGVIGIVLGVLLGGAIVAYVGAVGWDIGELAGAGSAEVAYGSTLYTKFSLPDALSLSATGLIITLLVSLYPAWLAARLEPVEALRAQ